MKYGIIIAGTTEKLEQRVQHCLDNGWLPQGGVAYRQYDCAFMQAMILPDEVKL